jgi:hypothetical protein
MNDFDTKNFFSKSKPNLILSRTLKKLEKGLNEEVPQSGGFSGMLSSFYSNYIEPNVFVLFLLLIFCLYLAYRYYNKEEGFKPTFNPSSEIALQNSYTKYLPDDYPLIMGNKLVSKNDLQPPHEVNPEYVPITTYLDERDSFVGFDNPYRGSIDQDIQHPYGWDKNFNTSTESAIEFSSEKNRLSLQGMEDNNKVTPIKYNDVYKKSDFSRYDYPFTE